MYGNINCNPYCEEHLEIYSSIISLDKLKQELPLWALYKKSNLIYNWEKIRDITEAFKKQYLKLYFPEIFKVIKLYLTIPVSSCEAERSFSCLKRLKTWLRNTMNQERLSALAILNIEKEFLNELNYEGLIDEFASNNNRRLLFF